LSGCDPVDLEGLRRALVPGSKPLVVNHWATWCEPCIDELPRLVRAMAGLGDSAEFLGVSWDLFGHPGEPGVVAIEVARVADSAGVGFPSVLFTGEPAALFSACGLSEHTVPQTRVLAPGGRVAWAHAGMLDDDHVPALVAAAQGAA
jgi:thiol-disulfide isomerase/thioredoxin